MKRPRPAEGAGGAGRRSAPAAVPSGLSAAGGERSLVGLELAALLEETAAPAGLYASRAVSGYVAALAAALTAVEPHEVSADQHEASHPGLPLRRLAGGAVAHLRFAPPLDVAPVGSYATRTLAKPSLTVDVAVTMPPGVFKDRDVKAHAYADKRALYLGALADALAASGLVHAVEVEALGGDVAKPVLRLTPAADAAAAAAVARTAPATTPTTTLMTTAPRPAAASGDWRLLPRHCRCCGCALSRCCQRAPTVARPCFRTPPWGRRGATSA
jgi:hypothetical protein